jgi:hypothetical protein
MEGRGESTAFSFLNEGLFRPYRLSPRIEGLFEKRARELGVRNPFEQAADVIGRIEEVLSEVPLSGELFPNIENPFRPSAIPDVVGQVNQLINQNPATTAMATAPGFVGQGNVNIDPVTRLTASEEVLLDPLEKRFVKNRRTNTRLT